MLESILTLLSSKRTIVAVVTVVVDAALIFGVEVDPEKLSLVITAVTALGGALIGGISVSDHGKAMGMPQGVDHKGRGVPEPYDDGAEDEQEA